MDTLQNGLTSLVFRPDVGMSLVDNEIIRALFTAMQYDEKGELWHFIIAYQEYPDPGILLRAEVFAKCIAKSEPGRLIDYAEICKDLATAEAELGGSREDKQKLFELCNKLVESHVNYVRATAKVLGFELYDQLIDSFYGKIKDEKLEHFLANTIPVNLKRSWPLYSKIKQSNDDNIRTWRPHHASAKYNIEQLKSSIAFKVFLTQLKSAVDRHEAKQRWLALKANVDFIYCHRPCPQAQTARLTSAQRRASIEKRNRIISAEKIARNERLKSMNLNNIHQLGDQSRICLPAGVIHALADFQVKYQATLSEDDKRKDDVDEGNVHKVVSHMHIVMDTSAEEPLGGIIIPDGFVHLDSMVGDGGV